MSLVPCFSANATISDNFLEYPSVSIISETVLAGKFSEVGRPGR